MTRYEYLIKEGYSQSQINQIAKIYKQTNLDISEVILPENPIEEYRRLGNLLIHYNYNLTKEKLLNAYNQIDVYEFENTNLNSITLQFFINLAHLYDTSKIKKRNLSISHITELERALLIGVPLHEFFERKYTPKAFRIINQIYIENNVSLIRLLRKGYHPLVLNELRKEIDEMDEKFLERYFSPKLNIEQTKSLIHLFKYLKEKDKFEETIINLVNCFYKKCDVRDVFELLTASQIKQIEIAIKSEVDYTKLVRKKYNQHQSSLILQGMRRNLPTTSFENPELTAYEMDIYLVLLYRIKRNEEYKGVTPKIFKYDSGTLLYKKLDLFNRLIHSEKDKKEVIKTFTDKTYKEVCEHYKIRTR